MIKYFYCQNCEENMVNASNKGAPWKFCRDCMFQWLQTQMLQDQTIKRLPDGEKHLPR